MKKFMTNECNSGAIVACAITTRKTGLEPTTTNDLVNRLVFAQIRSSVSS